MRPVGASGTCGERRQVSLPSGTISLPGQDTTYRIVDVEGIDYVLAPEHGGLPVRASAETVELARISGRYQERPHLVEARTPNLFFAAATVALLGVWVGRADLPAMVDGPARRGGVCQQPRSVRSVRLRGVLRRRWFCEHRDPTGGRTLAALASVVLTQRPAGGHRRLCGSGQSSSWCSFRPRLRSTRSSAAGARTSRGAF